MLAELRTSPVCKDLNWTIERQIVRRTWGQIHSLRVDATAERVVVAGSAPSYYLKQLAVAAVSESLAAASLFPVVDVDIQVASSGPSLT
jgi:hypothetical protein